MAGKPHVFQTHGPDAESDCVGFLGAGWAVEVGWGRGGWWGGGYGVCFGFGVRWDVVVKDGWL